MLLKKKNLSEILSGFQKTIEELNELKDRNTLQVVSNNDTINTLEIKNSSLKTETDAADKVLTNLSKLIDVE